MGAGNFNKHKQAPVLGKTELWSPARQWEADNHAVMK